MFHSWIIFGPTASGKTERALQLAQDKGADLLSFDSRQIYQGMSIATGQDIPENYRPQADGSYQSDPAQPALYGFNLIDPQQPFSIKHYYEYCQPIIVRHRKAQKPLVLVGGSWPYAKVLIDPPASLFTPTLPKLREELEKLNVQDLQTKLTNLDPQKFAALNVSDRTNRRRLLRSIEIASFPIFEAPKPLLQSDEYSLIIHSLPMETIETNLQRRIESRLQSGVLDETQRLVERYPDWTTPAFSSTGYRFLRDYLEKKVSLEKTKQLWFNQERQYAKRQITWVRQMEKEKRYNLTTL